MAPDLPYSRVAFERNIVYGYPRVELGCSSPSMLRPKTLHHVLIRSDGKDYPAIAATPKACSPKHSSTQPACKAATSKSLRRMIAQPPDQVQFQADIRVAEELELKVVVAPIDEVGRPGVALVNGADFQSVVSRSDRRQGAATVSVVGRELLAGVHVRPCNQVLPGHVAMSMAMRTVFECGVDDLVLMSPALATPRRRNKPGVRRIVTRTLRSPFALLDYMVECLLRMLLGAPQLAVRTAQMEPGADDESRVRLDEVAMNLLGVQAGDQVFISWAWAQRVAGVLVGFEDNTDEASAVIAKAQGANRAHAMRARVPRTVIARVSLPARQGTGLPPDTVVVVRRRVRPLVGRHVNLLAVPLVGVLLAAAAIQGIRGWQVATIAVAAAFLALRPLRRVKARSTNWPWG